MFNYPIQDKFGEALAKDGTRIEEVYRKLLGREYFEQLARLVSPKMFIPIRKDASKVNITPYENVNASHKPNTFLLGALLTLWDEYMVQDLDRRILTELGYNPLPWSHHLENLFARGNQSPLAVDVKREAQEVFSRLSWKDFMDWAVNFYEHLNIQDEKGLNFLKSYRQYRVTKLGTDQHPDLEGLLKSGRMTNFDEPDFTFYPLLSDETGERLRIEEDGTLKLQGSSRIVTYPLIFLPESVVEKEIVQDFKDSDLSPYLVPLLHEFHHFLAYALQRHPSVIMASLLKQSDKLK